MTFNITQKHIDAGDTSMGYCPIALAVTEALGDNAYVLVDYKTIYIGDYGESTGLKKGKSYNLPSSAIAWIATHDAKFPGTTPKPFSFELEIA